MRPAVLTVAMVVTTQDMVTAVKVKELLQESLASLEQGFMLAAVAGGQKLALNRKAVLEVVVSAFITHTKKKRTELPTQAVVVELREIVVQVLADLASWLSVTRGDIYG